MKILIVTGTFFPDEPGGAARVPWESALGLSRAGHKVTVLAGRDKPDVFEEEVEGVRVLGFPRERRSPLKSLRMGRKALHLLEGKPDIIHLHQPDVALPVLLSGRFRKTPKLCFFHSPWAEEYLIRKRFRRSSAGFAARLIAGVFNAVETLVLRRSVNVVTLSDFMAQRLRVHHPRTHLNLRRIVGAADTARFRPTLSVGEARRKLGWPGEKTVFFTVRNLEARMGLENLVDAFAPLSRRDPGLLLCLAGRGSLRSFLEERARRLGVAEAVRFLGRVSDEELMLCYQAADVFVLPTRELEGFGLVTVEALASGCPVVATPVGGTPEILSGFDRSLLTSGTSADDIGRALELFLSRRSQWPQLRRRAAEYAKARYSWERVAGDLIALSRGILKDSASPP